MERKEVETIHTPMKDDDDKPNKLQEMDANEEIMKELKNVKRQNFITHCLLSTMIVLTVGWQLSEFSMVLKIKNGLTNPFKSVGGLIGGLVSGARGRRGEIRSVQEALNQVSGNRKEVAENTSVPGLKIHGIPRLLGFESDDEEEE